MEYTIVPMDRSHVGQIAELERECFSAPWSEAMLTEALFDAQASFIVAESEDGGLLGYAGCVLPVRRGQSGLPHAGGAGLQRTGDRLVPQARL